MREDFMKLEQQSQAGKLRSVGAIADKLGVSDPVPTAGAPRALPKPAPMVSPTGTTALSSTDNNRIKRLEDVLVDASHHMNFCVALGIADAAYKADLVFSEWADDKEAPLSGPEWWSLVEPAYAGLTSWKRAAVQHLNHVETAKSAKTLKAFILAVLNDGLEGNMECKL